MNTITLLVTDLIAILVLVFGLYYRRHRRRDLIVGLLIVNLGVLAGVHALQASSVADRLGLGLFGILSIIRLRSSEVSQREVAYYFAALTLGVLGGLPTDPPILGPALVVAIVGALFVGDHPRLLPRSRHQLMTLDRAFVNERALIDHLETLLNAKVHTLLVEKVDLVQDTTIVHVAFEQNRPTGSSPAIAPS
jgi:Domain of unknown function (DUF4956)